MKTQTIIIGVIALLVVGGGSFYAGTKYQAMQRGNFAAGFGGQNGQAFRQRFGNGQNASAVRGQIISNDNGTITVKMRDGSTKLVVLSSSATIMKATSGSKDDLKSGEEVMIFGTSNSDGSVTAQTISINPMLPG